MAKSQLVFDPEKLEFIRRDRAPDWEETDGSEAPAESPVPEPEAKAAPPSTGSSATLPEGYVDPTPVRRRRRRRSSSRESSRDAGNAWRGLTWAAILIMGVLWVYMLYAQNKGKNSAPRDEKIFMFDRNDVIKQ